MKFDPHLPQVPSVAELLEHPRVKAAVARLNRSTVAQRAAGFVEELRASLARRTGIAELPSVPQLAERLARRLLGEPPSHGPVINATGLVIGDAELAPPLADAAVHAMMQVASEYHAGEAPLRQLQAMERQFCHLAGAEAAVFVNNVDAAIALVVAATSGNGEALVLETPEAGALGFDWHWLAARGGAVVRRISTADGKPPGTSKDNLNAGAILQAAAAHQSAEADMDRLSQMADARGACLVDVAPLAGLVDPAEFGYRAVESIQSRLRRGADVVVASGCGLLGGPACGVIVGARQYAKRAASHPLASLVALSSTTAAGLQTTLAAYESSGLDVVAAGVPVWQLLSAPQANLQQRAERLAALIGACRGVAAAKAMEVHSPWLRSGMLTASGPSWVVAVHPGDSAGAAATLARLRRGGYPIIARQVDDAVHLDLRSVFPRWDQSIVAAFESFQGG
ncbi:MAG: hypothetical protein DCC67_16410 [Planctomycetota bacterium]|nr:MAG: hypothetical protein DCC67_16410 [Planctomycetota bacterium]